MAELEPTTEQDIENEAADEAQIAWPIEWHIPETIQTRYATNIVVQQTEHEFFIYFFEIRPPMIFESLSMEERLEQAQSMASVRAECVACVAVAPDRIEEFVKVLQRQLARRADLTPQTAEED